MSRLAAAGLAAAVLFPGCSSDDVASDDNTTDTSPGNETTDDRFPAIIAADASYNEAAETWSFAVTVSSPYDTVERYADGWRVVGPDNTVYGIHTLTHDHAAEQPFTRRQSGVAIPPDVGQVVIEGRDLANGFGGPTLVIELNRNR